MTYPNNPNNCDHKEGRYETYTVDDYDEGKITETEWKVYSTLEDIDTHRMRCSKCGMIEYYSSRAREFYENGTTFPGIDGLE